MRTIDDEKTGKNKGKHKMLAKGTKVIDINFIHNKYFFLALPIRALQMI